MNGTGGQCNKGKNGHFLSMCQPIFSLLGSRIFDPSALFAASSGSSFQRSVPGDGKPCCYLLSLIELLNVRVSLAAAGTESISWSFFFFHHRPVDNCWVQVQVALSCLRAKHGFVVFRAGPMRCAAFFCAQLQSTVTSGLHRRCAEMRRLGAVPSSVLMESFS